MADAAFVGHGGAYRDLTEMMELYGYGAEDPTVGIREPWLPPFGETAQWGMLPFLEVLSADTLE